MSVIRCILAVSLFMASGLSLAAQQLVVATDVWEGYSNEDGTGYYTDLLKAIYEPKGINVVVKYVPYKRSMEMVGSGKADVMLGAYEGEDIKGTYATDALEMDVVDVAISPALAAGWKGLESLAGKKVGSIIGNEFNEYTDVKMQYKEVSKLKSLLKMLNHGRIDAVLDYEADIQTAQKAMGESAAYEIKTGVMKNPSFAVFSKVGHGATMLKIFNEEYPKLHQSGKLKALFKSNTGDTQGYPVMN